MTNTLHLLQLQNLPILRNLIDKLKIDKGGQIDSHMQCTNKAKVSLNTVAIPK